MKVSYDQYAIIVQTVFTPAPQAQSARSMMKNAMADQAKGIGIDTCSSSSSWPFDKIVRSCGREEAGYIGAQGGREAGTGGRLAQVARLAKSPIVRIPVESFDQNSGPFWA